MTGLEVLNELNRTQYSKLNPKASRILRNGIIRIIVILQESNPEIKYDIFLRLNRGSIKLNEQELRNCLYRGKFNDMIKELRTYPTFLKCIGLSAPHNRFNDAELVLRYFALSEAFDESTNEVVNYQNRMKTFLNIYMKSQSDISEEDMNTLARKFKETVDKVYSIFKDNAFRRVDFYGEIDSRMNRAYMDVIMLSAERLSDDQISRY